MTDGLNLAIVAACQELSLALPAKKLAIREA